jgi:(p)ppGpp synthase/HD superfamily hydrolase
MKELVMILQAADAVARWHVDQRRKGAAQEPYVNHLLEVASLVAQATDGSNPAVVIAALLHDAAMMLRPWTMQSRLPRLIFAFWGQYH